MSDEPTEPEPSKRDERRQAKSDAAATKARAKAARPWWKKKRVIIPAALLLLIVALTAGGGDGGEQTADQGEGGGQQAGDSGDDTPEQAPDEAEHAGVGEPAPDGQFTFTVNELDCGQTRLEGEFQMTEEAEGQWCVLDLTVENTGDEARSLSASEQYLYDDQDRRFSADIPTALDTPIYEQVNPGLSMQGKLYFDVPQDFQPQLAELHDSPLSAGVLVDLAGGG